MKLGVLTFIKGQRKTQAPVVKVDLTGKTVIVVGANTGLGFEAAKHFATMNPGRLILACRNESKGQAALEKLQADTGYKKTELWLIDLGDFESVKRFGDKFDRDGGRLDTLVMNAGISAQKYKATKDGWESSLQVNCIATPLVAIRLLPHLLRTAEQYSTVPRLVVVASEVHYWATLSKSVLQSKTPLALLGSRENCTDKYMSGSYLVTKLLNVLFVRAFNARLGGAPLIIDSVNPGFCHSELMRDVPGIQAFVGGLVQKAIAFPTEVGSRRLVWAAVGVPKNLEELRGGFVNACQVDEPSDFVISPEGQKFQDQIWGELVSTLGKLDPKVLETVDRYLNRI
ncbi:hypothetical protein C8R43DRAFT_940090 [Mycena crocata]|nr:hypothetical protein C8R43DRAFT_940090 [Mycena crocata]